jgi:hypothetical protein
MTSFPNLPVVNKAVARNEVIAPDAKSNNTVVEHKNFNMAHPQRVSSDTLGSLFNMLDFNNPSQETNGVIKGSTMDGGWFHLTPGVLKFQGCGQHEPYTPPIPPANDNGPAYPPVDNGTVNEDTGY